MSKRVSLKFEDICWNADVWVPHRSQEFFDVMTERERLRYELWYLKWSDCEISTCTACQKNRVRAEEIKKKLAGVM